MRMINGKVPVLMPRTVGLVELRKMAETIGCILKHDDASGMIAMVPRNECVRPAEDMTPRVVSIADVQRKEKPEAFFRLWKKMTGREPTPPTGPRAA